MSKADIEKIKDFGKKLESSGADYSEVTLRDIFTQAGLNSDLTERAIRDYQRYRESELSSLSILSGNDIRQIGAEALADKVRNLRSGGEIVAEILRDYLRYLNYKKQIAETYQESKNWGVVFFTSVYSEVKEAQEAFIDYVEEIYQTKVKDGKHLQKLTGITHLDSWDSKAGKYIFPDTEEEAKENAIRELEETVIKSRYSKYFRALEKALQEGAKYKDLLQIKPQDFGLPKTWSGCLGSDQYSSILWALSFEFLIDEPASLMLLPDLRSIAQEIEAPYSVLMDCYRLFNGSSNKKEDWKDLKAQIDKKIKTRLPLLMEEIGDKYYIYFDKEGYNTLKGKELKEFKEDVIEELKTEFCHTLSILVLNELKENDKKEVDELRNIISQDIVKYFLQELVDFKNSVGK